jgi:hypothetical protein
VKPAYVPPSRRTDTSAASLPQPPPDLSSTSMFPTLGIIKNTKTAWAPANGSFTQKIHEWIAADRMTVEERTRAAEKARELEGWTTISIPKGTEVFTKFNEHICKIEKIAKTMNELAELGLQPPTDLSAYRYYDIENYPTLPDEPDIPRFNTFNTFNHDNISDDEKNETIY